MTSLRPDLRASAAHVLVEGAGRLDTEQLTLDDDTDHHLRRVLRLRPGETVSATDGAGAWRLYVVESVASVVVLRADRDIVRELEPRRRIAIATAIPKGDRVDWLVQKATELGVDRILLLHCDRSTVRWKHDRAARQLDRLQRIADDALRQSRRVHRAEVLGPVDAEAVLRDSVVAEPGGRALTASDTTIAVGPEGGWTERELALAGGRIDLGGRVLRTETAAIAAAVMSQIVSV